MNEYEIWLEGYAASGDSAKASRVLREGETNSKWSGVTFQQACVKALNELKWQMLYEGVQGCGSSYYDQKNNSYWACRFFDNEADAKKSCG